MRKAIYGNDTFKVGSNISLNACVGNNGFVDIQTYQLGYYEATIALIDSSKKSSSMIDGLIYPIVFSARHTIELFLKNQLYKLKYINAKARGKDYESKLQATHSIKTLWEEYKKLTKVDVRYETYIKDLESYIKDYYEVDDTGETFRYPFDHEEVRHLTDFGCINIGTFEERFIKMYKIVDDLNNLSEFLTLEYSEGTVIKGLSRDELREIANELPSKKDWINDEFLTVKKEILQKYDISSTTFSKAVTLIKNHKEFASYIGIEIPLKEIKYDDLKSYINIYKKYRTKIEHEHAKYLDVLNDYTNTVCKELTADNIYALSALLDVGYFMLYPEAYERILAHRESEWVKKDRHPHISI